MEVLEVRGHGAQATTESLAKSTNLRTAKQEKTINEAAMRQINLTLGNKVRSNNVVYR